MKLTKNVRTFTAHGSVLARTGEILPKGTSVEVGERRTMHYDHRDQEAVQFERNGEKYWLIVSELGLHSVT